MSDLDKDIEILKELAKVKFDKQLLKSISIIKEQDEVYLLNIQERQAIENVLWALNGKDCIIETQAHNEEVLEKYIAKLEQELKIYKKIAEKFAEHIDFCPNNFEITKCEDYKNNCTKCRLEYARKEAENEPI